MLSKSAGFFSHHLFRVVVTALSPAKIKEVRRELFSLSKTKDELSSALASLVFERGATSDVVESNIFFVVVIYEPS